MDEEKRKYLEDLKKQIDPAILEKMSQHLGSDSGDGSPAYSGGSAMGAGAYSPADKIREHKASAFQRKVADRKRQEMIPAQKQKETSRGVLLIYSHNEFWSRIAETQFKNLGFSKTESLYSFEQIVRGVFEKIGQGESQIMVAVSLTRIANFITGWRQLQKEMATQGKPDVLKTIAYLLVVESMKQVPEEIMPVIGPERVIDLTDENQINREKIGVLAIRAAAANQDAAE